MQKQTDKEKNHDLSKSSGPNKADNGNASGGNNSGRGLGRGGGKGRRDGTGEAAVAAAVMGLARRCGHHSASTHNNLLLLNARPCCSEAVLPDKGAVARTDIVAALRRVDRKQQYTLPIEIDYSPPVGKKLVSLIGGNDP